MYFVPHFGHAKVYETSIWTPCFQISAKTLNRPMCFYSLDFYVLFHKSSTEQKIKVLNYTLHILIIKLPHCWCKKSIQKIHFKAKKNTIEIQIKMWRYKYKANQADIIKLAGLSESLAGLSDLGSNLPRLTTWVGRVLLNPVIGLLSLSMSNQYPCARVSVIFQVFLHHFVLTKLANSSIRVIMQYFYFFHLRSVLFTRLLTR